MVPLALGAIISPLIVSLNLSLGRMARFGQLYGSGSNGPASHRPSPARRSVHRSGAGANNRVSPSSSNRPLSSGRPPRRNNRNRNAAVTAASRMMDVDQGNAAPIASRPGRSGRRRGGGGRREGSRGGRQQPASRENLDKDLEKYMMRDAKAGKAVLDNDLDAYMMGTSELVALPGGNL